MKIINIFSSPDDQDIILCLGMSIYTLRTWLMSMTYLATTEGEF